MVCSRLLLLEVLYIYVKVPSGNCYLPKWKYFIINFFLEFIDFFLAFSNFIFFYLHLFYISFLCLFFYHLSKGQYSILEELLNHKADVSLMDEKNNTSVLHLLAQKRTEEGINFQLFE